MKKSLSFVSAKVAVVLYAIDDEINIDEANQLFEEAPHMINTNGVYDEIGLSFSDDYTVDFVHTSALRGNMILGVTNVKELESAFVVASGGHEADDAKELIEFLAEVIQNYQTNEIVTEDESVVNFKFTSSNPEITVVTEDELKQN